MQAVAADLAEPLDAASAAAYAALYHRQPWLGGLSPPLLLGALPFAAEAVWEAVSAPADAGAVGTLHRMLQYYAVLAPDRRKADRERKRAAAAPAGAAPPVRDAVATAA
jgi:hypothetical protein